MWPPQDESRGWAERRRELQNAAESCRELLSFEHSRALQALQSGGNRDPRRNWWRQWHFLAVAVNCCQITAKLCCHANQMTDPTWPKLLQSCSWFHLFRLRKPKERKHHRQPQAVSTKCNSTSLTGKPHRASQSLTQPHTASHIYTITKWKPGVRIVPLTLFNFLRRSTWEGTRVENSSQWLPQRKGYLRHKFCVSNLRTRTVS